MTALERRFVVNGIVGGPPAVSCAMADWVLCSATADSPTVRKKSSKAFYTAHLWRGFFASFDLQHVNNPGYNKVRGPVFVPGVRFHVDF